MNSESSKQLKSPMTQAYAKIAEQFPLCREEIVPILDEFLDTIIAYNKIKELVLLKLGEGGI